METDPVSETTCSLFSVEERAMDTVQNPVIPENINCHKNLSSKTSFFYDYKFRLLLKSILEYIPVGRRKIARPRKR
jgi:hypothetical protein